ncbi:MAG TPA: adenylate/guanylate cyclase domain-containing protein [Cyanobacteria bacterium UBA8543]|nr:adenylate/guanylate cyclase domain-containing protein [Cyanobacteria bacterium UBA8543]
MPQLLSRFWNGLLQLFLKHTVLILALMFCIAVGLALSSMSRLSSNLIESQALQNAVSSAKSINEAFSLYSDAVVDRAKKVKGMVVMPNYLTKEGAIPNPATFQIELAQRIGEKNSEMNARIFSDYPFPYRKAEGGARDDFERKALDWLKQNPKQPFYRQEKVQSRPSLRYAEAIIMKASCVACHNTDPSSPKKDWKVGDVRGVLEINQPLDTFIAQTRKGLAGTSVMLGGISVLGLSGLTLVIGRLRQTARELEGRVRERTADLAQANTDLEKRNTLIRQVFGRYLTDEVVATLLETPKGLKLGGDRRKITILTSDLRGFTSLSERLSPEEVINILNLYLEYMADVITKYQGTIDEFMGDGILVLFGAPTARADDAVRAIACACAMQLAMGSVNEKMKQLGLPSLEMGIGINTGEVVVGNIGSEKRTKYGIVGSQVNLTYRIESYTTAGQILISEPTLKDAGSIVKISGQKQVKPKGVKEPITIYEIYGIAGFYNLYLPREEELFFPIAEETPIQYALLDGKNVSDSLFRGNLVELSAKGAKVRAENVGEEELPLALTNLKLNLLTSNTLPEVSEDIYAKVLEKPAQKGSFYIRFTGTPPAVQMKLDALYQSISPRG